MLLVIQYVCVQCLNPTAIFIVMGVIPLQDEKKRFDKSSHQYYDALQKHLGMTQKKKEMALVEVCTLYLDIYCVVECTCS